MKIKSSDHNVIKIWTDGANRNTGNVLGGTVNPEDKAAYGFYMTYNGAENSKVFGAYGKTNNYCEIMGVYEALSCLKTNRIPVRLYSDSAYVVNCLNSKWYVTWRKNGWDKKGGLVNKEEWKKLISVYEKFKDIEIIKVKGHSNNEENNLIDRLLNEKMDSMQ